MEARISISMDEKLKQILTEMAWQQRKPLSEFIRKTLKASLKIEDSEVKPKEEEQNDQYN